MVVLGVGEIICYTITYILLLNCEYTVDSWIVVINGSILLYSRYWITVEYTKVPVVIRCSLAENVVEVRFRTLAKSALHIVVGLVCIFNDNVFKPMYIIYGTEYKCRVRYCCAICDRVGGG